MTQLHGNGNFATDATAPGDRSSLGRLIGAGMILVGLVLLALGAYLGPYTYATATPGKLTIETCTVDYKYRSSTSSSSRKKTKTRWCYGTFTADDGTAKDLNAELKSDALYQRGHVIEALKTSDTSCKLDHGWLGAIAVGCAWGFGALIVLTIGVFGAVTGFSSGRGQGRGLFRTSLGLVVTGVIGLIISLLVAFFV
ncbi:hypothetical protein J7F01_33825 [Streptomyces sp. ISL-22]|uniref:hypothetical protein n=1 Tax=unclassified Streptomyces TaxID=2593676 RepID=UPI001BED1968|nr:MULTISPECIES: hypothetical protein [unclassified Streptomyces]MBT2421273.1 hypothetical protein [Streptomyces sp. ISL-24]MBT2437052.1 hypothetical protein [Streptomyces sp. ISL-22]